jgi:putative oxidoreductase
MNIIHKIEVWGDRHHPKFLDLIRVALGIFILLNGIAFMESGTYVQDSIKNQNIISISPGLVIILMLYITFALIVGGAFIAMGIFTRIFSLIQLPNLLIVLLFSDYLSSPINAMMWPVVTALLLLVLFVILGSGPFSFDHYLAEFDE